jgi:Exo-beta-D-glucosaminidase Ig-fold domain/Glycosyl hydrolases family 2/Glycosyl hydrolases family 2, sugar binding domain/Glycosyl hydrolases family 2, TIM barrel domain
MKFGSVRKRTTLLFLSCFAIAATSASSALAQAALPAPVEIASGWQLQDAAKVPQLVADISAPDFATTGWHAAVVPGTVLTSLVQNGVYPDPLYGENNRPNLIPESLARTNYWYRTTFIVPQSYAGRHIWLNFDGVNYTAAIWVNGKQIGSVLGAFARGAFDISSVVQPGSTAVLAVLVSPQPHPGVSHEHTIRDGMGLNGGMTAIDGPTFLSTIGWDWIPAIRDRDTGIWQKVFLSASGPVLVKNPLITTDLPLPHLDSADIAVKTTVENITDQPQRGVLKGSFGDVSFEKQIELAPHSSTLISFDPSTTPALHLLNPKLWWPNGYGPQNLYTLHLSYEADGQVSDRHDTTFGVRKITYTVPDSENLTLSVNGVRVFIRGGDWGLDDAMKRIPRERLEAQIRMHQLAHLNMIRNWVGQSTNEDFYELCDKYGILLWDEFFQPNPSDGPNPMDLDLYLANVREKILRFRNHPAIAVWCARNEGYPPQEIDDALRKLMAELEPTRLYQPSSTAGRGVHSNGPYYWRAPREFYAFDEAEAFKTEIGSVSIPTLESIHGMMPQKDWETINDDWAEHDLAKGAQRGNLYPGVIADRYGKIANLADFVRKAQLANYEAFRAMYEGRNAKMFHPSTGVLTWMSHPAQPSFVWQLYHYDLEPNSSLFAVRKAGEMVHIQLNESNGQLEVINNAPEALDGATAHLALYNLEGTIAYQHNTPVHAAPSAETNLGEVAWPANLSPVYFVKLELRDKTGKLLSDNFYWRALPQRQDNLQALNQLAPITLEAKATRADSDGKCQLTITLHNPGTQVALMAHLQLRRKQSGGRVLPVYYSDNYVSLVPNESKTITIEAAEADLKGDSPLVVVDGWNVEGASFSGPNVSIAPNVDAQVAHWPVTGLPMISTVEPAAQ